MNRRTLSRPTSSSIPGGVQSILSTLHRHGYEAYLVGGCVRDLLLGDVPTDYDIATDARPDQVEEVFEHTVPVGVEFGTVLVNEAGMSVHVTTYRTDFSYRDGRRPSHVEFGQSIEADLARRDFTINAIAWDPLADRWIDPFGGCDDLQQSIVRAVGDPRQRFREDSLRTLRAIRFAAHLSFDIEPDTWQAIELEVEGTRRLSAERVRDEFLRILSGPDPSRALWMMRETGLFLTLLPEFKGAERLSQHKPGAPTLLDHLIATVDGVPNDPVLRLAALLHDIGKLTTKKVLPSGQVTFHGHPEAGARIAEQLMKRLKIPRRDAERVIHLVRMHMALWDDISAKTLRRWIGRYGEDFVRDLIDLARADGFASGRTEEDPALTRIKKELDAIVAEDGVLTLRDLAVDGRDLMSALDLRQGPVVGKLLHALYELVLDDPTQNDKELLLSKARDILTRDLSQ